MATYPGFHQSYGTKVKLLSGVDWVKAGNRQLRGVVLGPDKYEIRVMHKLVLADRNTLRTFRITNLLLPIDFTMKEDNVNYANLHFISLDWEPVEELPNYFNVTSILETR